jgi:hypothetical protein
MANPNLRRIVKTSTSLSLKGTYDSDTGTINTEDDNFDLLVLLEYFSGHEVDFSVATKGCTIKFKGLYGEAAITTEEGDTFDILDFIRPLGYLEVKVNVKSVEEKDESNKD